MGDLPAGGVGGGVWRGERKSLNCDILDRTDGEGEGALGDRGVGANRVGLESVILVFFTVIRSLRQESAVRVGNEFVL